MTSLVAAGKQHVARSSQQHYTHSTAALHWHCSSSATCCTVLAISSQQHYTHSTAALHWHCSSNSEQHFIWVQVAW